jgi:hypothetical protein
MRRWVAVAEAFGRSDTFSTEARHPGEGRDLVGAASGKGETPASAGVTIL